jgi:hypothetical protein
MSNRPICNPSEVERLLHHMPTVAAKAENDWARGFAKSITKQARRKDWWPSQKQLPLMRELVTDLFRQSASIDQGGDTDLIES